LHVLTAEQGGRPPRPDYSGTVLTSGYMTEMARLRKPWFAMFGAVDRTVPTDASVKNILRYMAMSQNTAFAVAVIPRCGHTPVDTETKRRVLFENLMLNWFAENIAALLARERGEGEQAGGPGPRAQSPVRLISVLRMPGWPYSAPTTVPAASRTNPTSMPALGTTNVPPRTGTISRSSQNRRSPCRVMRIFGSDGSANSYWRAKASSTSDGCVTRSNSGT
jgi:hypothetical protein